MTPEVTEILKQLAQKLGTTTEFLWTILVKQQYIDGYIRLGISVFVVLIIIISFLIFNKYSKNLNNERNEYGDYSDKEVATITFIIVTITLSIIQIILFVCGIKLLSNPEYYALKEILNVLK